MNVIWSRVEALSDAEVDAASVGVRGLRAVMELDAELAIGGLPGFFGNSAGRLGPAALELMRVVDEACAARLQAIFDRCGLNPYIRDSQARLEKVLATVSADQLHELRDEAMGCISDFVDKLPQYIRAHPDEFFNP